MLCHGCNTIINSKDYLKCNNCSSVYCYLCLNITVESTKQLSVEQLAALSCPSCQNVTRRKNNDDTPVKQRQQSHNETLNLSFSQVSNDSHLEVAMNTPSGSTIRDQPVTMESISQLFDLKLSMGSAFVTNLRSALKKDVEELVAVEVSRAVEQMKVDFSVTTEFIVEEHKDIRSQINEKDARIKYLESKLEKTNDCLSKLQNRLSVVEKISRDLNLEIHEVPENRGENPVALFKNLCETLKVVVSDADIRACRRVAKMNMDSKRPRNILVTLSSQRLRDTVLSAVTRFNKAHSSDKLCLAHMGLAGATSRVFVAEHLSSETKELYSLTRKFCKDNNYKFNWVRYGQIYIRKDEMSPAILVKNSETLSKLKPE